MFKVRLFQATEYEIIEGRINHFLEHENCTIEEIIDIKFHVDPPRPLAKNKEGYNPEFIALLIYKSRE